MKSIITISILSFIVASACQKTTITNLNESCSMPPPVTEFVVLDKDGNSLVKSKSDKVSITYLENGTTKSVECGIGKLTTSLTDTTTASKYNGMGIASSISSYSVRAQGPIKNFEISINDKKLGTIYFDMVKSDWAHGCYIEKVFLFNNDSVKTDNQVIPFVALLKLK